MTTRVSRREMQNFTQHVTQQVKSLDTYTAYLCLQAACLIESTFDLYSRVGGGKAKLYHLPSLYAIQPQISLESVPSSLVYRMRILGLCWRELKRFDHDLRSHPPSSNHNMAVQQHGWMALMQFISADSGIRLHSQCLAVSLVHTQILQVAVFSIAPCRDQRQNSTRVCFYSPYKPASAMQFCQQDSHPFSCSSKKCWSPLLSFPAVILL